MAAARVTTVPFRSRQLRSPANITNPSCTSARCSTSKLVTLFSSFGEITTRRIGTVKNSGSFSVRERFAVLAPALSSRETSTSTSLAQEVEFTWKGQGSEVLLTGDFLNWETQLALVKKSNGVFTLTQKLALGRYSYKFLVDGEWKFSPESRTVPDGHGGFNNEIVVTEQTSVKTGNDFGIATKASANVGNSKRESASDVVGRNVVSSNGPPARPLPRKVEAKSLTEIMTDNVIPQLRSSLSKGGGITNLSLTFDENQLRTSFAKGGIPYCFWVFFPDGILEGSRGSSLTSHGSFPSTIEPFLVDEKKITPELLVFWIKKRLLAQKILTQY